MIIALMVIMISSSVSLIYSKKLVEQTGTIAEQNMHIITKGIDEEINVILGLCDSIRDQEVLQEMMAREDLPEEEAYEQARDISKVLRQSVYSHTAINSIFAFGLKKQVYDPLYQISPYREMISQYQAFDDFIVSGKFNAFSPPSTFPNSVDGADHEEKSTITYFSQYLSNYNFRQLGYILINIKKDYLFRDVEPICAQVFDFTYVIDERGNIIYQVGAPPFTDQMIQAYGTENENASEIKKINGNDYYLMTQPLGSYPDWKVVGGMAYGKVKEDALFILKIVYLIGAISILIAVLISYFLSKKVTDPILDINQAMAQFEKRKWPGKLKVKTEDELKSLINGFNHMVEQFRALLDQVHQEHEEKKKVEVETLELKLELLQAQINPHFVHNTLNALQYLALKRGADDIREMIQSFNLLLRASMSVGRDFISIKEELDCVDSYLNIQKYRYDNEVQVVYEVEEGLNEIPIPKLILQPIVENALYHGIIPKDTRGTIRIKIYPTQNQINILVSDDGVGMDEEELNNLFKEKERRTKSGFNNIGLNNINARLRLYYGDAYSLKIQSKLGQGTCVWFTIPRSERLGRRNYEKAEGAGGR
ncbi:hypothetical protein DCMF_05390 [Candidatus Formimonas warabiya]|uniref:histidine kinase n=2 Tax=Formimonas warabiya TaxID=1761012 RepID=A0A3G1L0S8_FORW1|nr:hypothetical protein DCMF_05390 [Candidatus Formimonas warabiya]